MIIYLYVKTHNITGLKYLGKTTKNPYKYLGSGIEWLAHIKEHGKDISTEVLIECDSNQELGHWGRHYSTLWDVANSPGWANQIPETGGSVSGRKRPQSAIDITASKNRGKKRSEEFRRNRSEQLNSFFNKTHTDESRAKMSQNHHDVKGVNNPMYGKVHPNNGKKGQWEWANESKEKVTGPNNHQYGKPSYNKGKSPQKFRCEHCMLEISKANLTRWHSENCKSKN